MRSLPLPNRSYFLGFQPVRLDALRGRLCAWFCFCLPLLASLPVAAQAPVNQPGVVASFDAFCGDRTSRCRLLIDGSSLIIRQQFRLEPDGTVRLIVGSGVASRKGRIINHMTSIGGERLLGYSFLDCFAPAPLKAKSCSRRAAQQGLATIVYEQDDLSGSIDVLFDNRVEWQRFQRSLRTWCSSHCNLMSPGTAIDGCP